MTRNTDDTRLVTVLLVIIGAFVILPMVFMSFGMMGIGPMMGGGMWGGRATPGWMYVAGLVMQLLFLAVLVGGGYLVYRAVVGGKGSSDQVLEELELAYARGELTDDEYEQRRATLERDTE